MKSKFIRRDVLVGVAAAVAVLTVSSKTGFASESKTHDVTIKSFEFEPEVIAAKIGDSIRWLNEDLVPHTATALEESWDTDEIVKGESRTITVTKDMETSYFCRFHPRMKGRIELV